MINFKSLCVVFNTFLSPNTALIRQRLSAEMVSYRSGLNESMSRQRRQGRTGGEMWHLSSSSLFLSHSSSSWFLSFFSFFLDRNGEPPQTPEECRVALLLLHSQTSNLSV